MLKLTDLEERQITIGIYEPVNHNAKLMAWYFRPEIENLRIMDIKSFEGRLDKINASLRTIEGNMKEKTSEISQQAREHINNMKKMSESIRDRLGIMQETSKRNVQLMKSDMNQQLSELEKEIKEISKNQ